MKVTPQSIQKYIQEHWIGGVITLGAIIVVTLFHWIGVFDSIELKTYDYRFNNVRGPLTGWTVSDSTYINKGTDVVLVEVDDEAYRLLPEEWPYPRGSVWGRVVRNLYKAGAKVIVFDIQFDTPDKKSEIYQELIESTSPEYIIGQVPHIRDTTEANYISKALPYMVPRHGDKILGEAISEAQMFGTTIVMDIKMATEATSVPPQYIVYPVDPVKNANPEMGLINDQMDMDGFSRRYAIFGVM
nr:CHASE2 domain-containing protein [Candidatus Neomarinimicrobiota bacterium]